MRKYPKFLILVLVLLPVMLVFASCVESKTPSETDTDVQSEPDTDTPIESPTEIPTEPKTEIQTEMETEIITEEVTQTETETEPVTEPDLPETDKYVIQPFEEGEPSDQLLSRDWSTMSLGITNPVLSSADTGTDIGKGFKVTLTDNAICQYFELQTQALKNGFVQASSYKYLRLWINNQSGGTVSVGFEVYGANGTAASDGNYLIACRCDGTEMKFSKNDASGMGQGDNTFVAVPDGFEGWISFPLSNLTQYYTSALLNDISTTYKVAIDFRPSGYAADGYYVIDELALTNEIHGERRKASGKGYISTNEEKRKIIDETYAALLNETPVVKEIPEFTPTMAGYTHIKAITYDGMDKNGQKTKVFAYIGFPEGASSDHPVPAIVLIHGGGGHAFLQWIKMWNDRGYAAIAMDNTGCFPTVVNAGESESTQGFTFGLSGIFKETGYVNAPNNDGMGSSDGRIDSMWMYHAVGQTIIANNILRADARVDSSRIGVTGISWGGVITALAIGWDNRFAFAIPIYGSAYLTEARSWIKNNFAGQSTQELWSAADRLDKVDFPVLWLCWNDDNCFSINSNTMSYHDTTKLNSQTRLSAINQMMHSHSSGWNPAESMTFADAVVKGTPMMPGFTTQPSGRTIDVVLDVESDVSVRMARLYYITAPQTYSRHQKYGYTDTFMDQEWKTIMLTYDKASCRITGEVPADAAAYYIEVGAIINKKGVVTCSEFIELK